eukprot:CAMPEP_0181188808 /NCGR_PEP_ID=MMETSP1096-20121128/11324_1 /TAXON_ID=156174 ORGANISM="Chrysochromulina ericina, Strain CCMP281" /NCGR_SAMPLE_ID=MMETSP1096 /ASSEMBLY_ACC=CAM_ASM_000453 /LENGTH=53 /DNA_ID=CAMNT_0023277915 /DNA_START=733 /DNA_END=894 /DNA_ORIENTATION=-
MASDWREMVESEDVADRATRGVPSLYQLGHEVRESLWRGSKCAKARWLLLVLV